MSEERYTFSSLLSKLIEIQDKLEDFYKTSAKHSNKELAKFFSLFLKECEEIKNEIEKAKRESVIEFALEPISGLKINDFLKRFEEVILDKEINNHRKAEIIEEEIAKLFSETSKRISHMSAEVSQLLMSASKKAKKRLEILRE
jgi:ElaB/YqjD/DUF883 family membrane-anchored ribosome-binding protein